MNHKDQVLGEKSLSHPKKKIRVYEKGDDYEEES